MNTPHQDIRTEAAVVADLAVQATEPSTLEAGRIYAVPNPAGGLIITDTFDRAERPARKTGTVEVHNADSFSAYLEKHGLPETELYADTRTSSLVAVLNAHGEAPDRSGEPDVGLALATLDDTLAGWGDHRLALVLHKTPAWTAWEALDRKLHDQADFAEHVEERLPDFVDPTGADMLELAQTFQATRGVEFDSSNRLADGQVRLNYRETTNTSAGTKGQLQIPTELTLALRPFEGGQTYKVTARFRYRLERAHLRVGYLLTRPDEVLAAAFLDEVKAVTETTGRTVLRGTPLRR